MNLISLTHFYVGLSVRQQQAPAAAAHQPSTRATALPPTANTPSRKFVNGSNEPVSHPVIPVANLSKLPSTWMSSYRYT
ncbi:hypothetical protein KPH14_011340 [Odynerus spinipes]|uniref:Uncharacterized protein n=1 Tax=Odynerus spinipes TaxID=1348599 RepID=A0AAD9VMY0_9HYME|nr:hypothetical protein KPH14_011340 [Odynerus spinipes]